MILSIIRNLVVVKCLTNSTVGAIEFNNDRNESLFVLHFEVQIWARNLSGFFWKDFFYFKVKGFGKIEEDWNKRKEVVLLFS